MRRAINVATAGAWPSGSARGRATLDWDHRHRRRMEMSTDDGARFLLDLPRAAVLREGDGLKLDDGGWIAVRAKPEALCEIRCASAAALARIAWHLGNRHLPVEIGAEALRIRDDHVIAAMLSGMGASVTRIAAPFTPEGGAYAEHGHDH
jgi:urease accessory protein